MTEATASEMIESLRRKGTFILTASARGFTAAVNLNVHPTYLSSCTVKSDSDVKTLGAALRQLIDRCEAAPKGFLMGSNA